MSRLRLLSSIVSVAVMATVVLAPAARATFPARNGLITFMANTGSGYQIYTVRPNGHDLRQVTHVDGEALKPDLSPDGRRIAFAFNECSVAIIDVDGSDLTVLPSQTPGGCEADPSFTPDGSRLVFERYDPATEDDAVWSMSLDGTDRQRITSAGAPDPNVSPDGKTVSFLGGPEDATALFTASLDGGNVFQVTPFIGVAFKHDWAPDGRHLVITDNANDLSRPANIATVRPDGTGLRYLTHYRSPELRAYVGSYSPDGQWIVFRLEDHGSHGLYRMRPDGSDLHPILRLSSFKPQAIDWGPALEH
jgi:Tol biopolymer transport system component